MTPARSRGRHLGKISCRERKGGEQGGEGGQTVRKGLPGALPLQAAGRKRAERQGDSASKEAATAAQSGAQSAAHRRVVGEGADARPDLLAGGAKDLEDAVQLVDLLRRDKKGEGEEGRAKAAVVSALTSVRPVLPPPLAAVASL